MKTLDRYIIREFLLNFAILLVVLLLLFVLIDVIEGLGHFLEAGRHRAEQWGGILPGTLAAVLEYYAPIALLLYVFFSGLVVVGAAGFTIAALQRSGELVAIVASGTSLYRVAGPILVLGAALNALALPLQEWVVPRFAEELTRSKSDLADPQPEGMRVFFANDGAGNLLSAADFDPRAGQLRGLTMLRRDEAGQARQRITANQAFWDAHAGGWRLAPPGRIEQPHEALRGAGVRQAAEIEFIPSDLSPSVLMARRAGMYPQFLSMAQLQQMQHSEALAPHLRDRIRELIWSRLSLLVANLLVLLMGLGCFLRVGGVNMLRQGALAAGVCIGAWGLSLFLLQVAPGWVNPVAAAWLPVVLLLPLAAWMFQWVKT